MSNCGEHLYRKQPDPERCTVGLCFTNYSQPSADCRTDSEATSMSAAAVEASKNVNKRLLG